MNVREATSQDTEAIHDIARQSIQASYAVSPTAIDVIIEEWFDARTMEDRLDDSVIAVAETDDNVVGFVEGNDDGELLWLHVHPEERGRGAGTELFEWIRETLRDRGADDVRARVLADNSEGDAFLTQFGYERVDERDFDFGGESWREYVYAVVPEEEQGDAPAEPEDVPSKMSVDGEERFVDSEDRIPGDAASFYPLYHDEDYDKQFGYYCSNCDSAVGAVDELDRIECTECGNVHRPDEWDDAYL